MKRYALTATLKDDTEIIRKYEEYHANAWPEVLEGSYKCGVRRTFIYRKGRQLFMFMETVDDFDMQRDMPKYKENNPRADEWDSMMREFMVDAWVEMKEVFGWEARSS